MTSSVMTPRTLSPLMLIQEFLRDEPWKLLCAVIMLNQTSARQVWRILPEFFDRYPDAAAFLAADVEEVKGLIRSLGFRNRRYERLAGMSRCFASGSTIDDTYGIGKYGRDSYKIFCEGYLVQGVEDKELKKYVRWAEEQAGRAEADHAGP